jgi:hypothetical protein
LRAAPYNLLLGNSIYAQVAADNYYGLSTVSESGNGALLQLVPDAPILLTENVSVTTRTLTEFSWSDGFSNGGASVIDYQISYDQSIDVWQVLATGIATQTFRTTTDLIEGREYKFKV